MPWCPNCKMEYVTGKTICADCGTELVDQLPISSDLVSFMETEKEKLAHKFVQFLHYSKIEQASYEYDEEKKLWIVFVKESKLKQVKKLYQAFYSVETAQQLSEKQDAYTNVVGSEDKFSQANVSDKEDSSDELPNGELLNSELLSDELLSDVLMDSYLQNDELQRVELMSEELSKDGISKDGISKDGISKDGILVEDSLDDHSMFDENELQELYNSSKQKPQNPTLYVKKEEQYKDLISSAVTFFLVAILGIAVLIINAIGIIDIFEGPIPNIVMGLLFTAFLYVGVTSYIKSRSVKTEIGEENSVTEAINTWLSQNITIDILDSLTNSEDTEEIRFFHKIEKMKEMINTQFGDLDESYLDSLAEEFYNKNLEV